MADKKDTKAPEATEEKKEEAPAVEEVKKEDTPKEEKKEEKEEAPKEAKKEEAPAEEEKEVKVPAKFKKIVEEIEKMSVLDLNELVKVFEEKFGVSAAAVAVAGPAAGGDAGAEEKSEFTVELTSDGGAKIPVMKVIKEVLGLGLKEAKDLVESAPAVIKEGVKKEEAEEIKGKIEEAGGKVTLK